MVHVIHIQRRAERADLCRAADGLRPLGVAGRRRRVGCASFPGGEYGRILDVHPVPAERIERRILRLRGQKALLDFQLADLYAVETQSLNQAVKRNLERFPGNFMFRLSEEETERVMRSEAAAACAGNPSRISGDCYADGAEPIGSRPSNWSQVVTRSKKHRGLAYRPYAFTEQGVDMFSSVLRSLRAFRVIIAIRRSFVQLRQLLVSHADLAKKWADLEGCYDRQFKAMFDAIRELMEPPMASQKRQMGFHTGPSRSLQKSDADAPSKIS